MSKSLLKNILRSIYKTKSRFISIIAIVALGISFFAGLKATNPDMLETAHRYFKENNLMDLRIQSNIGLTASDAKAIEEVAGVEYVMPSKFVDGLVWVNDEVESDIDGSQFSARAYGIALDKFRQYERGADDGSFMNRPTLIDGVYPTEPGQCLVDASVLSTPDSYQIGNVIKLEGDRSNIFATLNVNEFEIVGIIRSPYYISFERGNTLVGSGKISTYIYIPEEAFDTDYYTEIYVTVEGARSYAPYSEGYFNYVQPVVEEIENISSERLEIRTTQLALELPAQIEDGKTELFLKKVEAEEKLIEARKNVADLKSLVDNGDEILRKANEEYRTKFGETEDILFRGQEEYNAAVAKYNSSLNQLSAAEAEWNDQYKTYIEKDNLFKEKKSELETYSSQLKSAETALDVSKRLILNIEAVLSGLEQAQEDAINAEEIQSLISVIQGSFPELYASVASLTAQGMATDAITLVRPMLDNEKTNLALLEKEFNENKTLFEKGQAELNVAEAQLKEANSLLTSKYNSIVSAKEKLAQSNSELESFKSELTQGQFDLKLEQVTAKQELNQLTLLVNNAEEQYAKGLEMLNSAEKQFNDAILLAQTKIDSGEKMLESLDDSKWYVYNRNDTPGYKGYGEAAQNIKNLANVFPLFFVLVAALVCQTTIARMVEEERTQVGTLMALGYDKKDITKKYIIYALLASIIGSFVGLIVGFYAFPYAIFSAYGIMYTMPPLVITFPLSFIILGVVIGIASTVATAYFACRKDMKLNPAVLMRPKAPGIGKRIFLEKVPFIWSRFEFTSKVTARNIFRNKQRFMTTLFGVAGCTALLLAGFGTSNSVTSIMREQFESGGVSNYDFQIVFNQKQEGKGQSETLSKLSGDNRINSMMLTSIMSVVGSSDRADKIHDVYIFVPESPIDLNNYINLEDRSTGEIKTLNDNGALITEKFAKDTDTKVGQTVKITTTENKEIEIPVAGIVENYTFHYIYITPSMYSQLFGETVEYTFAIGKLSNAVLEEAKNATAGTRTSKTLLATDLMQMDEVTAVGYQTDTVESFSEIISALAFVVMVFIGSAAALAFVVLYNLSNININERVRELATIKVLGFFDKEVSQYIYRENIFLTTVGIMTGLIAGIGLHQLMIDLAEVDTVMFVRSISWQSFLFSALLTALFSGIINLIMHRKLKKISMVDSLKSVE